MKAITFPLWALMHVAPAWSQSAEPGPEDLAPMLDGGNTSDEDEVDLTELDLADLLEIEVTVVSRRAESLEGAPAPVYVITGEEIRRAGHSSIQEALRMVPGLFVSHWTSSDWDATIRGFGPGLATANVAYLNQVLVMIDGVVVYTPLFAGMWWALQDIDLEDVERIEVIRGPSGILWGANAFHGLVHVITKSSAETQGTKLSARVSNDDQFLTARFGGQSADGVSYRAWVRRTRYDGLHSALEEFTGPLDQDNLSSLSDWGVESTGLQFDWDTETGRRYRVWARAYTADVGYPVDFGSGTFERVEESKAGGQLAFALDDPNSGTSWRAAYVKDRQEIRVLDASTDIDHLQLEVKRELPLGERHTLSYGLGYDLVHSVAEYFGDTDQGSLRQNNFRAFVSDTWSLPERALSFSFGVQAVRHEFSGFDVQPTVRASWSPKDKGTFWAALSRAIRTPSIEEELFGFSELDNEVVIAAEAGWRGQLSDAVALDLAVYHNDYDDVRFEGFDALNAERILDNRGYGRSSGAELAVDLRVSERWTLRGAYAFHRGEHGPSIPEGEIESVDGQYPVHLVNLRSYYDLAERWELDAGLYAAKRFDDDGGQEHFRLDTRLGWRPTDDLRLALGVQGFNEPLRAEYFGDEARRLFYVSVSWSR